MSDFTAIVPVFTQADKNRTFGSGYYAEAARWVINGVPQNELYSDEDFYPPELPTFDLNALISYGGEGGTIEIEFQVNLLAGWETIVSANYTY